MDLALYVSTPSLLRAAFPWKLEVTERESRGVQGLSRSLLLSLLSKQVASPTQIQKGEKKVLTFDERSCEVLLQKVWIREGAESWSPFCNECTMTSVRVNAES